MMEKLPREMMAMYILNHSEDIAESNMLQVLKKTKFMKLHILQ